MTKLEQLLGSCITDPCHLPDDAGITEKEKEMLSAIAKRYPISIPPYYLSLIDPKDKDDPIRKLCLPSASEQASEGTEDTSGESHNTVLTGVQHKYAQTVLVLTTNRCAMYCRHCFRKRMVGYRNEEILDQIMGVRNYVMHHPEVNNVLLSGGDAFLNENEIIREYLDHLTDLDNLDYIRFGTRTPVVLPMRIYEDEELLSLLKTYSAKKQIIIVTHFDHPRELTPQARMAVQALLEAGCPVRNQTVLLKGVNDDPTVLASLLNGLVGIGVLPYYVFQCRPARGVMTQFQVPLLRGAQIVDKAKEALSGQAKAFRYALSHPLGKVEILGLLGNEMLFKFHQAKDPKNAGRIFTMKVKEDQCWLDDLQ